MKYTFTLWKSGVTEKFIRRAFSEIAQLDLGEWVKISDNRHFDFFGLEFKAWGNEVHIKVEEPKYECVIKEGFNKEVYVDEWRSEKREVRLEYGIAHQTNWWEVFRTGKHATSLNFVEYLRAVYDSIKDKAAIEKMMGDLRNLYGSI